METDQYNFYYESYRRVPMNSATTQKASSTEFNSIGTYSTYSNWSRSKNPMMTTTYIDGTKMLGQYERSYSMNNLFPKSKGRQKPIHSFEKKDPRDAYMSLAPAAVTTARSEKTHSPLLMRQTSNLPEVLPKSANIRNKRLSRMIIVDDNSQSKFYARCATTNASGGWIRRYKSINESQIISGLLRDNSYENKILLKKRPYQQLVISSSPSFTSLNKRRREKC